MEVPTRGCVTFAPLPRNFVEANMCSLIFSKPSRQSSLDQGYHEPWVLPDACALPCRSRYAFAAIDRQTSVVVSPRLALADTATWQGVLTHEMGHCIDFYAFPRCAAVVETVVETRVLDPRCAAAVETRILVNLYNIGMAQHA